MKRKQILNAALKLFTQYGFHGTSTAAIAEEARVANGTLFHYFSSKDLLIIELYLELKDNLLIGATEKYSVDQDLKTRMMDVWSGIIQWACGAPDEFYYIQQFNHSPYFNKLTDEQKSRHDPFFNELLSEGGSKNIFKDLAVDLMRQMNFSLLNGVIEYIFQNQGIKDDQKKMNKALNSIWDCLSK
jgi:AcrR family transcriptional regulator